MPAPAVPLRSFPDEFVIVDIDVAPVLTALLGAGPLLPVTQTDQETSIVCSPDVAPAGAEVDGPLRALCAGIPIPFSLTGVVVSLVDPLAAIGCPVFVVSTPDEDVLMTPDDRYSEAVTALRYAEQAVHGATAHG